MGRDIYSTFVFETSEVDKIKPLIKKFEEYCIPKQTTTIQRYKFNKRTQSDAESVDQYITELRLLAKDRRFGELQEELICDRIICGVNSERPQARLLPEEDLMLEKAINICKADEESRKQLKNLRKDDSSKVNFVKHKSKKRNDESKLLGKFKKRKPKLRAHNVQHTAKSVMNAEKLIIMRRFVGRRKYLALNSCLRI